MKEITQRAENLKSRYQNLTDYEALDLAIKIESLIIQKLLAEPVIEETAMKQILNEL